MRTARCLVVILTLAGWPASPGRAQAVPPSAPAAPPATASTHPDFSGTWTIDRNISVDPAQINLAPSAGNNRTQNQNRRGGSGGFGGRGFGGGFGGGGGYGRGGSRSSEPREAEELTADEQARIKALTDELKTASASLVISHHDPSFVVDDALEHAQFFQTDGSATENHVAETTIPSSTRWDGTRIVTEYTLGSHLTLVYTYTLLAASNQLVVRVNRKDGQNLRPFAPDVKLVYGRKS
jgi:hypothetical protein